MSKSSPHIELEGINILVMIIIPIRNKISEAPLFWMRLHYEFALCLCFAIVKTHSFADTTVTMYFELGTISTIGQGWMEGSDLPFCDWIRKYLLV